MSFIQSTASLRASVATYASLPLTSNVLGDLRVVDDLGTLYTWLNPASSGSLSDWHKVSVSSYNDLVGRPDATPLAIDDAVQSIRNIFLNYILIFFIKTVTYGISVLKMLNGGLDKFFNEDAVDLTRTSGQRYILTVNNEGDSVGLYINNFDGSLDENTIALIHGTNYVEMDTVSFDALRNKCSNVSSWATYGDNPGANWSLPISVSHFNTYAIQPAPNMGMGASEVLIPLEADTLNKDITWDFWVNPTQFQGITQLPQWDGVNVEVQANCYLLDNSSYSLEILEDGKIYGRVDAHEGGYWTDEEGNRDDEFGTVWVPVTSIILEVTSVSSLSLSSWSHIAMQRRNGYLELFINGILEDTSTLHSNLSIGSGGFAFGRYLLGFMDEIRYSDVARYVSNFTPMTVAYNTPTQSAPCNNMIIQSEGYESADVPTSARVVIFQDFINTNEPTIVPNTDIKVFVSRDGGTTFTQATDLKVEFDLIRETFGDFTDTIVNFLVGTVDLSLQPNGKEVVYKITTHNNKDISLRSIAINWK